jgi:hypothetical protein
MRIFLPALLFRLPVFLSPLINLLQAIITGYNQDNQSDNNQDNQSDNDQDNQSDILIIILDMCNVHKRVLPALNDSKRTIPDKTYLVTKSSR